MAETAIAPPSPTTVDYAGPYGANYYTRPDGELQNTFSLTDLTHVRVRAIADAAQLRRGDRVLDYGCGLGAWTAAWNALGYEGVGVDSSPYAVSNALPEVMGHVHLLGREGLSGVPDGHFRLAVAKDVFEHIPAQDIPRTRDELLRVATQLLLVIPTVGDDRRFIFPAYEADSTHVTRLTGEEWLALLAGPGIAVQDRHDLTPRIRRSDKVAGTLSALLFKTD